MSDESTTMHAIDDKNSSCQVAVRLRPLSRVEALHNPSFAVEWNCKTEGNTYWDIAQQNSLIIRHAQQSYVFDYVFGPGSSQECVFEKCCLPLVNEFFAGYNCCVFAYGQTGSGKTHTMMGSIANMIELPEESGILPRAARAIFSRVRDGRSKRQIVDVSVTFVEVYNEDLRDLLEPEGPRGSWSTKNASGKAMRITEDPVTHAICIVGARSVHVESEVELLDCLGRGALCRSTASNKLNSNSSRSHAIFTVTLALRRSPSKVESIDPSNATATDVADFVSAKFHFVDLAGSERVKRTQAEGNRLREGISINAGLLALSNVINALTTDEKSDSAISHIPYRDSKLTRILQDSLGGNSRTLMIACLSGAAVDFLETYSTIKYAVRARNIKNVPIVNRDPRTILVEDYQREIHRLTLQLLAYRKEDLTKSPRSSELQSAATIENLERELERRKKKELKLKNVMGQLRNQLVVIFEVLKNPAQQQIDASPPALMIDVTSNCTREYESQQNPVHSFEFMSHPSLLIKEMSKLESDDQFHGAIAPAMTANILCAVEGIDENELIKSVNKQCQETGSPKVSVQHGAKGNVTSSIEVMNSVSGKSSVWETIKARDENLIDLWTNETLRILDELSEDDEEKGNETEKNGPSSGELRVDDTGSLEAHYTELSIHIGRTDSLLRGAQSERAQYLSLVGNMREQIAELTRRLDESTSQKEELKSEISATIVSRESSLKLKQEDLTARYKDEVKKVKHYRKQLTQLGRQLDCIGKKKSHSERQIELLQKSLRSMKAEQLKTRKKIQEQEEKFRDLLARKETQITQMKRKEAQQASEIKRKESKHRRQYEKLQKDNDDLLKKIKQLATTAIPSIASVRSDQSCRKSFISQSDPSPWDGDAFRTALRQASLRELEQRRLCALRQEACEIEQEIQTSRLNLVNVETELQQLISDGESVIMTQRKLMTQARALKDGIEALEKQKTINDEKLSEKESQLTSFEQQSKGQSTSPSVDVRSVTGRFTTWLQKTSGSSDQNVNAVTEAGGFVNGLTFSGLEGLFEELLSLQLNLFEAQQQEQCRQAELDDLKGRFDLLCYHNRSLENEMARQRCLLIENREKQQEYGFPIHWIDDDQLDRSLLPYGLLDWDMGESTMTDDEEGNQRKFQRPATATLMRGSSIVSVKRGKSHNTRQCSNGHRGRSWSEMWFNRLKELGDDDWDNDDDQVLVSENLLTLSPSRMNQSNSVSNDDADNDSDISSLDINWPSKPFESPTTFVEEKVCLGKTNKEDPSETIAFERLPNEKDTRGMPNVDSKDSRSPRSHSYNSPEESGSVSTMIDIIPKRCQSNTTISNRRETKSEHTLVQSPSLESHFKERLEIFTFESDQISDRQLLIKASDPRLRTTGSVKQLQSRLINRNQGVQSARSSQTCRSTREVAFMRPTQSIGEQRHGSQRLGQCTQDARVLSACCTLPNSKLPRRYNEEGSAESPSHGRPTVARRCEVLDVSSGLNKAQGYHLTRSVTDVGFPHCVAGDDATGFLGKLETERTSPSHIRQTSHMQDDRETIKDNQNQSRNGTRFDNGWTSPLSRYLLPPSPKGSLLTCTKITKRESSHPPHETVKLDGTTIRLTDERRDSDASGLQSLRSIHMTSPNRSRITNVPNDFIDTEVPVLTTENPQSESIGMGMFCLGGSDDECPSETLPYRTNRGCLYIPNVEIEESRQTEMFTSKMFVANPTRRQRSISWNPKDSIPIEFKRSMESDLIRKSSQLSVKERNVENKEHISNKDDDDDDSTSSEMNNKDDNDGNTLNAQYFILPGTGKLKISEGCAVNSTIFAISSNSVYAWDHQKLITSTSSPPTLLWSCPIQYLDSHLSENTHIIPLNYNDHACLISYQSTLAIIDSRIGRIVSSWNYGDSSVDLHFPLVTDVISMGNKTSIAAAGTDLFVRLFDLRHGTGIPQCQARTFVEPQVLAHIPLSKEISCCPQNDHPISGLIIGGRDGVVFLWKEGWIPLFKHSDSVSALTTASLCDGARCLLLSGSQRMRSYTINTFYEPNPSIEGPSIITTNSNRLDLRISALQTLDFPQDQLTILAGNTIASTTSSKNVKVQPSAVQFSNVQQSGNITRIFDNSIAVRSILATERSVLCFGNSDIRCLQFIDSF